MQLDYTIKRSAKRRKLTIIVERDRSVIVHAPTSTSDGRIAEVVESKRQWIYEKVKHEQKYDELRFRRMNLKEHGQILDEHIKTSSLIPDTLSNGPFEQQALQRLGRNKCNEDTNVAEGG